MKLLTSVLAVIIIATIATLTSAVSIDDMKCQVCDVAAAHYTRTLLHAQLYCLNKAYVNASDGTTPTKLSYLVKILEPFKISGINSDFCSADSPAKRNPEKNEGVAISTAAGKKKAETSKESETEAKREADEIDEVLKDDDSGDKDSNNEETDGPSKDGETQGLVVDAITATEIARKNFMCRTFLDSFPAIELFPAQEGASFDPDDPKTYDDEEPQRVPPKFIELLQKACELALVSPRKNAQLVGAAKKAVADFSFEDAPRTKLGVRNHIYKKALKQVQQEACASNCPGDMQRPKNFKAISAFSVHNKPIIQ